MGSVTISFKCMLTLKGDDVAGPLEGKPRHDEVKPGPGVPATEHQLVAKLAEDLRLL